VLALALLAAPGCDWLKGSGGSSRVSPFLSGLRFSRGAVLCEQAFTIAFDYDDPQDDLSLLTVSLQHATTSRRRSRQVLWDDSGDLNLQSPGRAELSFTFACADPGGRWLVEVQVEDLRGHLSNTLRGEISLTSAN